MPTYQYRCKECGHDLEVVQSFNDEPLSECPECSGPLRKVYGSVGISFKGSGFYKNDARSSGSKSASTSGSGSSSEAGTSESKKSETTSTSTSSSSD